MSMCCNSTFHMHVAYVSSGCCKSKSSISYVTMAIHVCCKGMVQMFHLFQTYVASVSSGYCICCSGYTHILQVCFTNVSAVSSICCMFLPRCCICSTSYTRMLQVYVLNVSPISDICCKCFSWMLLYVAVVIHI
jgi:hypothetical protein